VIAKRKGVIVRFGLKGMRCWASRQTIAKPMSIKGAGCKSGGCVRKAVELTSGDLLWIAES